MTIQRPPHTGRMASRACAIQSLMSPPHGGGLNPTLGQAIGASRRPARGVDKTRASRDKLEDLSRPARGRGLKLTWTVRRTLEAGRPRTGDGFLPTTFKAIRCVVAPARGRGLKQEGEIAAKNRTCRPARGVD